MLLLIRPGNSKLGEVPCFSILAGHSCPGKTKTCAAHCYAMKGFFRMTNVRRSHVQNWEASKQSDFAGRVIDEIERLSIKLLRIHVAGDFYNAPYVRKWIKIADACPDTQFYAYTRSWRRGTMLRALTEAAARDNFQMWWSADKDTHAKNGEPPTVPGVNVAYMQCDADEPIPAYANLVFRLKPNRAPAKFIDGCLVCPVEQGRETNITCETCRVCFNGRTVPSKRHA